MSEGLNGRVQTAGTFSLSVWEEAASVVTLRLQSGTIAFCLESEMKAL